ncbi:lysophospholipid acyltransferase family protein [Aquirufa rosea]|uniref:1-acyl-sn-glycerol-3-phosphate acyltransferase n=1 Tax=Aquirufa rosea TaxID=2509241 RepID=A0A4Q1C028_9BACT|nr:lysophospholipid acyltransferase family protein [Aquirufa rosea]RXK49778.1 1-acyl-sn-glycerol-3-phosphate acyltransferase [Aquirufa rosea]
MKKKNMFLSKPHLGLFTLWSMFWFLAIFLLFYPFIFILLQKITWRKYAAKLVRVWSKIFFFFCFIRFDVKRHFEPDINQNYVFCANHFSFLDIPVIVYLLEHYTAFVGKSSLGKLPLFGYMYARLNILVNRSDNASRAGSLAKAMRALQTGRSIAIFPEGGIVSKRYPYMSKPLKDGALIMAIQQQIPLVPISLYNNYEIFSDKPMMIRPGVIRAEIHPPIITKGLSLEDVPMLREKLYHIIQDPILKYHSLDEIQ